MLNNGSNIGASLNAIIDLVNMFYVLTYNGTLFILKLQRT